MKAASSLHIRHCDTRGNINWVKHRGSAKTKNFSLIVIIIGLGISALVGFIKLIIKVSKHKRHKGEG